MTSGLDANDFINGPLADFGKSVTHTPITKTTSNVSGQETLTDGTPVAITAVFLLMHNKWYFDKEGLVEGGDAYLMAKPADNVRENDKITAFSETFRVVGKPMTRYVDPSASTASYIFCNLFRQS